VKTAVWQHVRDHAPAPDEVAAVAASFQEAVVDMLLTTTLAAAHAVGAQRLVIAGGVAANSRLRQRALAAGAEFGLAVHLPSLRYCTDNAAMIAYAGRWRLARGDCDPLTLNAAADLEL
jgi:N6-L-threonylcarbamoyladenine synthase